MKEYKDLTNEAEKADGSTKMTIIEGEAKRYASLDSLNDEKFYLERRLEDVESEIRYCVTRIKDLKNDKKQLVDSIKDKENDVYEIEKLILEHNKLIEESDKVELPEPNEGQTIPKS